MVDIHRAPAVRRIVLLAMIGSAIANGCQENSNHADGQANDSLAQDTWDVILIQGRRAGYAHTVLEDRDEQKRSSQALRLQFSRDGVPLDIRMQFSCASTAKGELRNLLYVMKLGNQQIEVTGELDAGQGMCTIAQGGNKQTRQLAFPHDVQGFLAVERSLLNKPMGPGESRTLSMVQPLPVEPWITHGSVRLMAKTWKETDLPGGTQRMLPIEQSIVFGQAPPTVATLWMDASGEVLKTHQPAMNQTTVRTTKQLATAPIEDDVDLFQDLFVELDRPLPEDARSATFEVKLEGRDAAEFFPETSAQHIAREKNRVLVTLRSVSPTDGESGEASRALKEDDSPTAAEKLGSDLIQSDDPRIERLAESVASGTSDSADVAIALERLVHDYITDKGYSQIFDSAVDVFESRAGDCTEHAVLLAALCRARDIPARVATGLVYFDERQGFAYHAWTEAWINGRLYSLDATLGKRGIGPTHLKVADSSLDGAAAFASLLPVADIAGRLEMRLVEVEGE